MLQSCISSFNCINTKILINFDGRSLKQNKVTFTNKQLVNIYIVYEINLWQYTQGADFTLGSSLFGVVTLTNNADPDIYSYSGYGIGFDACGRFSFSDGSWFDKNVIIFSTDMGSSVRTDNKNKDIMILGKGPTDGLEDTTLTAEK